MRTRAACICRHVYVAPACVRVSVRTGRGGLSQSVCGTLVQSSTTLARVSVYTVKPYDLVGVVWGLCGLGTVREARAHTHSISHPRARGTRGARPRAERSPRGTAHGCRTGARPRGAAARAHVENIYKHVACLHVIDTDTPRRPAFRACACAVHVHAYVCVSQGTVRRLSCTSVSPSESSRQSHHRLSDATPRSALGVCFCR